MVGVANRRRGRSPDSRAAMIWEATGVGGLAVGRAPCGDTVDCRVGGCSHLHLAETSSTKSGIKPQATNQNDSRNSAIHLGLHPEVQKCMHRQPASLQKVRHIQPEAKKMGERRGVSLGHFYMQAGVITSCGLGVCLTRTMHMSYSRRHLQWKQDQ